MQYLFVTINGRCRSGALPLQHRGRRTSCIPNFWGVLRRILRGSVPLCTKQQGLRRSCSIVVGAPAVWKLEGEFGGMLGFQYHSAKSNRG